VEVAAKGGGKDDQGVVDKGKGSDKGRGSEKRQGLSGGRSGSGTGGGGVYCIRDLGSLNGTIINGKRISAEKKMSDWMELSGGDRLVLGDACWRMLTNADVC
jgi:hypothetical protein